MGSGQKTPSTPIRSPKSHADPVVEGSDVALIDDQNKIIAVLGFLDKVPS
jgi:hypothetical protein